MALFLYPVYYRKQAKYCSSIYIILYTQYNNAIIILLYYRVYLKRL